MRKQYYMAFEDISGPVSDNTLDVPEIDPESELVENDEANKDADFIVGASNDVDAMERRLATMDDIANLIDSVKKTPATVREVGMMDGMTDIATQDIGSDSETVNGGVEAMEAWVGKQISTEGFRGVITRGWDATVNMAKAIWDRFMKMMRWAFDSNTRLLRKVNGLKKKIDNIKGQSTKKGSVGISDSTAAALTINGELVNKSTLMDNVKALKNAVNIGLNELPNVFAKVADAVSTALGAFDPADPLKSANSIAAGMAPLGDRSVGNKFQANMDSDPRYSKAYTTKATNTLLGNKRLVWIVPKASGKDVRSIDTLKQIAIRLVANKENLKNPKGGDVATLTHDELSKIQPELARITEMLVNYADKSGKKLERYGDQIKNAVNKASKSLKDDAEGKKAKTWFEKGQSVYTWYSRTATVMPTELIRYASTTVRALYTYCTSSIADYSAK